MSGHGSLLKNQEIMDQINVIAEQIKPFNQSDIYDNGDVLGHHSFQFYSQFVKNNTDSSGIVFGTVTHARLETAPVRFFLTVQQFKCGSIEIPVRRERALDILYKLRETKKYIDFILNKARDL